MRCTMLETMISPRFVCPFPAITLNNRNCRNFRCLLHLRLDFGAFITVSQSIDNVATKALPTGLEPGSLSGSSCVLTQRTQLMCNPLSGPNTSFCNFEPSRFTCIPRSREWTQRFGRSTAGGKEDSIRIRDTRKHHFQTARCVEHCESFALLITNMETKVRNGFLARTSAWAKITPSILLSRGMCDTIEIL